MNILNLKIGGWQPFSLIDYPETRAAIIFTKGCNFRCGYCHNPELACLAGSGDYQAEQILEFLEHRIGKLEGLVITGGEPTLQPDLLPFMKRVKEMGYRIKLDSNGSSPKILKQAVSEGLTDYVAMDIKAPIEKYREVSHYGGLIDNIEESRQFLMQGTVPYEFRTTVVRDQLTPDDFEQIGKEIAGSPFYAIQKFIPTKTMDKTFLEKQAYSDQEMARIQEIMSWYVGQCVVR